ncbi:hypothetical protein [Nocardia sp. NPDC057440]|uniref:ApeA N-terminal domain 1-containing protein n=1 Tax=Nocardia sp. NPDC057440 TaxID=3346134 RepID=UPI00366ABFBC
MDQTVIQGTFWYPESGVQSAGELTIGNVGQKSTLSVLRHIMPELHVKITSPHEHETHIAYGGTAEEIVEDFAPRTFLGQTEDGQRITLVDAQGGSEPLSAGQQFDCKIILIGDNHVDAHQRFTQCRYMIAGDFLQHLHEQQALIDILGGSVVDFEYADNSIVITARCEDGAILLEFEQYILGPLKNLMKIVTGRRLRLRSTHVRVDDNSAWLEVHITRTERAEPKPSVRPGMMHDRSITEARVAKWIEIGYKADSLVDALAGADESGPIETQVITLCAVAEGLHRKLLAERVSFPNLTKPQLRTIRKAVREAALQRFHELEEFDDGKIKDRMNAGLNMLNDISYRARINELSTYAKEFDEHLIITSAFADWAQSVQFVRNKLVHQLPYESDDDETELTADQLRKEKENLFNLNIAVAYSLSWVLRLTLLKLAGFKNTDIVDGDGLPGFQPYEFSCANVKFAIKDHPNRRA